MHKSLWLIGLVALALLAAGCSAVLQAVPTPLAPTPVLPTLAPLDTPTTIPAVTLTPLPQPTPTNAPVPTVQVPTAGVTPAAPVPTAPVAPSSGLKRITFSAGGTSATLQGTLGVNGIDRYVLRAQAGQTLLVTVSSQAQTLLSVNGANGDVYKSQGAGGSSWNGVLRMTQDYILTISTPTGTPAVYTLLVAVPPITPTTQDVPQRIEFAPGATAATVSGSTATPGRDRFVLRAQAGQTLTASVTPSASVILIIYGADGNVLISDHAGVSSWSGTLPTTQDYFIDTRSVGSAVVPFNLTVTIPPVVPPTPVAKRITFPAGGITATVQGTTVNGLDRWVVRAAGGQTMTVQLTAPPGQAVLVIFGVDGTVLISDHAGATSWTGPLPTTQDYIIDARSVGMTSVSYTLTVTIPPK